MSFCFIRDSSLNNKLNMARAIIETRDMYIGRISTSEFGDKLRKCCDGKPVQPEDLLVIVNERTINLIKGRY